MSTNSLKIYDNMYVFPEEYTYINYLGKGTSGVVFLIQHNESKKFYAYKCTRYTDDCNTNERIKQRKQRAFSEFQCISDCDFFAIVKHHYTYDGILQNNLNNSCYSNNNNNNNSNSNSNNDMHNKSNSNSNSNSNNNSNNRINSNSTLKLLKKCNNFSISGLGSKSSTEIIFVDDNQQKKYNDDIYDDKFIGIIMDYINDDLKRNIKYFQNINKHFDFKNIEFMFVELMLSIYYIHKKNICHRDLKPGNIFIDEYGILKLGDFGFSKIMKSKKMNEYLGTPYYLAPEIWLKKEYDLSCDVYSLGIILYELLTLEKPFKGGEYGKIKK
jgi:serine/threonine protein kinase